MLQSRHGVKYISWYASLFFFFQAEDGIRDYKVTGVQTCALPIFADRLLGAQRAVLSGGLLITLGNAMLALGNTPVFFLGLLVIVMGVGLLKPNVSAMVAALYPEGGSRRDAGFYFF